MRTSIPLVRLGTAQAQRLIREIMAGRETRGADVLQAVTQIVDDVRDRGDQALFAWTRKLDNCAMTRAGVRVSAAELAGAAQLVAPALRKTLRAAARRIRAYHQKQIKRGYTLTTPEARLTQRVVALHRVGVYIPGGYTVYPSTVLMDVIPAQIAGVSEIVAVTPPRQGLDPAIAFVLEHLGIKETYRVGGAQAVAALAFGTASIRRVDKIVGPGNAYVSTAKKLVFGTVDIDTVAGPSEVAIMADGSVDPDWVALDLLAQAEHGTGDEVAVCITESIRVAQRIVQSLNREIDSSPVREVFGRLAPKAIAFFVARNRAESIAFVNDLGPEHLQIMTATRREDARKIRNAAAIFLGPYTPVAMGDYFIGTNHVLPTGGAARFASPLGVESFLKRISVAEVSASGLRRASVHVSRFARAEGFVHHALSVERRVGMHGPQALSQRQKELEL
jgi:histidinol dehydrogenase